MEAKTRYARTGDDHVAYQVLGEGPDLLFVPGWITHVEMAWEVPPLARFLRRLASFSRLMLLDKRGTGMSDPLPRHRQSTLEERMDDVRAVMDAVGSERATLLGASEGGPMSILFAATHPQRTSALVLFGTFARILAGEGYDIGLDPEIAKANLGRVTEMWGQGYLANFVGPSMAEDPAMVQATARYERLAASPRAAAELLRLNADVDVRHVLPSIRVPTLVLHRKDERFVRIEHGRYLAEHIPGARLVELEGSDHLFFAGNFDTILDEIEEFVTGERHSVEIDRILTTILFTDIVDSTRLDATRGRQWRDMLDAHDAFVRRQLARFRGREINTTGDGFFASFDGPPRALECAAAIVGGARQLGMEIRAGVHTGECEIRGDDLSGVAVHAAARITSLAGAGEVFASSTVRDLVAGSELTFQEHGEHELAGLPGKWRVFRIV
ncbi:MAG TPA: adenylate/guanylate cyclase domain-containing protein [Candidatus Binatia bacterium]|nr:adenylate/guanylate cyclase domain-containing protein [Candidatus Binatia bacterium]